MDVEHPIVFVHTQDLELALRLVRLLNQHGISGFWVTDEAASRLRTDHFRPLWTTCYQRPTRRLYGVWTECCLENPRCGHQATPHPPCDPCPATFRRTERHSAN